MSGLQEVRAEAIQRYAEHVKTHRDKHGHGYSAEERTLMVIGYADGWDACIEAASLNLLQAVESATGNDTREGK